MREITPEHHKNLLEESLDALRGFREDQYRNSELATGVQWSAKDQETLEESDRYAPVWDIISPNIEAWIGTELSNRQSVRVVGRDEGDKKIAEIINKVMDHDNAIVDLPYILSIGARYASIYRYVPYYLSFEHTMQFPEGQYVVRVLDPMDVFFDHKPHDADFEESNYIIYTRWFTVDHIIQQYAQDNPELAKRLEEKASKWEGVDKRTKRRQAYIQSYGVGSFYDFSKSDEEKALGDLNEETYKGYTEYARPSEGLYRVIEVHEKVREEVKVLFNYKTGVTQRLPRDMKKDEEEELLLELGLTKKSIRTVWLDMHYISVSAPGLDEKKVLYHEPYAVQGMGYAIKIMPFYNTTPNRLEIRSLVDKLKDMQELVNREQASRQYFMQQILNPSWLVGRRAIDTDTQQASLEDRRAGKVMVVNDASGIKEIYPSLGAASLFQQSADLAKRQGDFAIGFGENIRGGRQDAAESGKVFARRVAQQESMLTSVYMNITRVLRQIERYHLGVIQTFYTTPRLIRIQGPGGQQDSMMMINQYDPTLDKILNDVTVGKFDIELDKGKFTESDKEYRRDLLGQLIQSGQPEQRTLLLLPFLRLMDIPDTDLLEEYVKEDIETLQMMKKLQKQQLVIQTIQMEQQAKQLSSTYTTANQLTEAPNG